MLLPLLLLGLLGHHTVVAVSEKGLKLANDESENEIEDGSVETTTSFFGFEDDDFMDFSLEDENKSVLPACNNLTQLQILEGALCTNETLPEPEIRYDDLLFQRLITQVWTDFQIKLNTYAEVNGIVVDPLDIDARLPEPIDISQKSGVYSADVKMKEIMMFGLSDIKLDEAAVTRSENLTDMSMDVRFAFDELLINGSYSLKGFVGWWELDSKGVQKFSITMKNATFSYQMRMDIVDDWATFRCGPEGNVIITELGLPLAYDDIDFKFEGLGSFANTVVNGVGIYFLQSQEETLIQELRTAIKKEVNSLIC